MDLELVKTLTPWLLAAFSVGASLVMVAIKRSFATKKEVDELRQEQKLIRSEIERMPDSDEFHELRLSIEGMRGDLKVLNATLKPLEHIHNLRIENDLLGKESA